VNAARGRDITDLSTVACCIAPFDLGSVAKLVSNLLNVSEANGQSSNLKIRFGWQAVLKCHMLGRVTWREFLQSQVRPPIRAVLDPYALGLRGTVHRLQCNKEEEQEGQLAMGFHLFVYP
jgi:hypothetical protein